MMYNAQLIEFTINKLRNRCQWHRALPSNGVTNIKLRHCDILRARGGKLHANPYAGAIESEAATRHKLAIIVYDASKNNITPGNDRCRR